MHLAPPIGKSPLISLHRQLSSYLCLYRHIPAYLCIGKFPPVGESPPLFVSENRRLSSYQVSQDIVLVYVKQTKPRVIWVIWARCFCLRPDSDCLKAAFDCLRPAFSALGLFRLQFSLTRSVKRSNIPYPCYLILIFPAFTFGISPLYSFLDETF